MRLSPILIITLIVVAVYIMPQIAARFTSSHTVEGNMTGGGVKSLKCVECHQYILDEANGTVGEAVFRAHEDAAKNTTYTQNWLNIIINETREEERTCYLCHLAQVEGGTHTQITTRVCTDLDCHGTNESSNNTAYPTTGNIGPALGGVSNVHEDWFDAMTDYTSSLQNETGTNYTLDYWACLGCHTGVGVNMNATEPMYPHDDPSDEQRRYF